MNCNVTLTAEEFKTIHNTLWAMQYDGMDAVIGAEKIREALKGAYDQEHNAFDTKMDYFDRVREELGLSATWSMYEIDNLSERHPFEGVETVTYKDHWGDQPVVTRINGSTWAALYVAANAAIRDSGDEHHVFIENFKQVGDTLILSTGS
jgi:hypothetical protein